MSFLDLDERLLEVHQWFDLVYSPLVDMKEFPESVDVTLIEGAVGSQGDLDKIVKVRKHTKTLVSLGDCAVHGNVPALRNKFSLDSVLDRAYRETVTEGDVIPDQDIPRLLEVERPVHESVRVDVYVPGCPPSADTIYQVLLDLAEGRKPDPSQLTRFGA
jgi:NAD-reducing hydrogenase small subunit